MRDQKPITKSFELVPGRDDDILEYLENPVVSISAATRQGLRLLIQQSEGRDTFETKAIELLQQIIGALSGGVVLQKDAPPPDRYDDPFIKSSL